MSKKPIPYREPKIQRNMQRDREINHHYQSKVWTVLRFWDFEVKEALGCVCEEGLGVPIQNILKIITIDSLF
ncbi:very short patch repair endonuclease [Belliella sp. DSM 107340]|uniref:Very short patch repair endonuclease n=2 Tax=Belliella calami TaxID=2923436 RepID=A0ABS9UQJ8_9BACT|nr:very short patch repair endonuclease [Belliella calami]